MDDPIAERLNRLQVMIDLLREEASCLKTQLDIKLEKDYRDRLPSEESRRPISPLRRRRSDFSPN